MDGFTAIPAEPLTRQRAADRSLLLVHAHCPQGKFSASRLHRSCIFKPSQQTMPRSVAHR